MEGVFLCPHCGVEVPENARACPGCGSDEKTGWSPVAGYAETEYTEEDYEDAVREEFGERRTISRRNTIVSIVAIILIIAFILYSII